LQTCVGGTGCGHGCVHGFGGHVFAHELLWPNTDDATINDATIHGFVFVSKFSIFCSPFWTNSLFYSIR
jgi:hypothetical protein